MSRVDEHVDRFALEQPHHERQQVLGVQGASLGMTPVTGISWSMKEIEDDYSSRFLDASSPVILPDPEPKRRSGRADMSKTLQASSTGCSLLI